MLYLFLWIAWLFLLFRIIFDIFRSKDLSGWGKAGWTILIVILPWLGALIYLIARGGSMHERDAQQARDSQAAMDAYIADRVKEVRPTGSSPVDELAKLADLHKSGAISDEEFASMKAKVLA
jgi:cytochrome P450